MEKEIKTEHKMIKVNKELHKLLKIESVSSGKSMQNIAEKAIKNYIHISKCIE